MCLTNDHRKKGSSRITACSLLLGGLCLEMILSAAGADVEGPDVPLQKTRSKSSRDLVWDMLAWECLVRINPLNSKKLYSAGKVFVFLTEDHTLQRPLRGVSTAYKQVTGTFRTLHRHLGQMFLKRIPQIFFEHNGRECLDDVVLMLCEGCLQTVNICRDQTNAGFRQKEVGFYFEKSECTLVQVNLCWSLPVTLSGSCYIRVENRKDERPEGPKYGKPEGRKVGNRKGRKVDGSKYGGNPDADGEVVKDNKTK
ncbi:hypothetical protein C8R45DRAFT_921246 [Mycena sanguinolenta]|nr:hypothetical protein C8R45DRAFT_921246 [Mycena sanguinolenta]